jgi:hypothetical protein
MKLIRLLSLFIALFLFSRCATYKAQYAGELNQTIDRPKKEVEHTFYLIGDTGNAKLDLSTPALDLLKEKMVDADENSTLIFLGDNVYPVGIPKKKAKNYDLAKYRLQVQLDLAKKFPGEVVFIPGNHDWYSGLKQLEVQEDLVDDALGKNSFLPENGCPLQTVEVTENIQVIYIDTHWYITNWDRHPGMNDKCQIKTREKFLTELEGMVKKARGKTTILALHHPMFTQGPHGGYYSFKSHMKPLPVLGTLSNLFRKTAGLSNADQQNKRYNELKARVVTLAQHNEKSIFVSGHEHSIQYIIDDNIPQIVSGSGSKQSATKLSNDGLFAYGKQGIAILKVYKDGSSHVDFYADGHEDAVFTTEVYPKDKTITPQNYPKNFSKTVKASIYTDEEVAKGKGHTFLWGERYRKYYGIDITAPTVDLDTLYGGLTPARMGGGHQSKSLRLLDKEGREYMMRALRKQPVQYLQAVAFKDEYIQGSFDYDFTRGLMLDIFTGAHPYAPFTVERLSEALGIFHTEPVLFYVPKQSALGEYNAKYGGELYMIEKRPADEHFNEESFGYSKDVKSTDDLITQILEDEEKVVDEKAYIRARLFDMLIGDWDRHEDQWRWSEFKENGKKVYRPVPRDRDQAFSKMADGAILSVATRIVPALRLMQSYDEDLRSPKWFNLEPYPLDVFIMAQSTKKDWDAEVDHIVKNLTDQVIEEAFENIPKEVRDASIDDVKKKLRGRRKNLQSISDRYYAEIQKFQVVKGTYKDDWFDIIRMPNGKTKISVYRIKDGKKKDKFHEKIYDHKETEEIWVYGLDDDDYFYVDGDGDHYIKIRIIGGQNKDTYEIKNGRKIIAYDYKSKKSKFLTKKGRKVLTDDYETNVFNHKKLKYNSNQFVPSIGFNPDDGLSIGFSNTYTVNKFLQRPFTRQHTISGGYYLATNGFDLNYKSEFAKIFGRWNAGVEARFASPNYARNFFGFGNESVNMEPDNDNIDRDFNRVRIGQVRLGAFANWRGHLGAEFKVKLAYESFDVERTAGRFIENAFPANSVVFNQQDFITTELSYAYENKDNDSYPMMGMAIDVKAGYTRNLDQSNGFPYLKPSLEIDHRIDKSGILVFATKLSGQVNFSNDFQFFQGAVLGARNGLRGYRWDRFVGKSSFAQSTDIRMLLNRIKTNAFPLYIGIYGGFDYGKVWFDNTPTGDWNTSYGGGIFFNAARMVTGNISAFQSDDSVRIAFTLGFGF